MDYNNPFSNKKSRLPFRTCGSKQYLDNGPFSMSSAGKPASYKNTQIIDMFRNYIKNVTLLHKKLSEVQFSAFLVLQKACCDMLCI